MNIITEPKVQVVGYTVFQEHPVYKIPPDGTDFERLGAFAAKSCYDSHGEDGRACRDNQREIIAHGHGSVLEHLHVSLFIEGITRALTLELNRHRPWNISQRSTRYTKEENAAIVLEPYYAYLYKKPHTTINERDLIENHIDDASNALDAYRREVELLMKLNPYSKEGFELRKWARGKARNILPHNLETRGTWTGNIRAWRHFIETRSSRFAEEEIRRLAYHVYKAIVPLAPVYFEDYNLVFLEDPIGNGIKTYPEFITEYKKV